MLRKMYDLMNRGLFGTGLNTDSSTLTGAITKMFPTLRGGAQNPTNFILSYGDTLPSAVAGYAVGGLFVLINVAAGTQALYANTGTTASCTFTKITDLDNLTPVGNLTIATGKTLTVTDLSALLVNTNIVNPFTYLSWKINPANTSGEFIFTCDRAYTLISVVEIHNVVAGQACAGQFRKILADGNLADATAGANVVELISPNFDLTSAAATPVTGTLVGGATSNLASGNKLAFKMGNGSSLVGGNLTIKLASK